MATEAELQAEIARLRADLTAERATRATIARERDEAHEQQAASAELLRLVSTYPTNVQPVFDTVVGHAVHLSGADNATLQLREEGGSRIVARAGTGLIAEALAMPVGEFVPLDDERSSNLALRQARTIHGFGTVEEIARRFPAVADAMRRVGYERRTRSDRPLQQAADRSIFPPRGAKP